MRKKSECLQGAWIREFLKDREQEGRSHGGKLPEASLCIQVDSEQVFTWDQRTLLGIRSKDFASH